MLLLTGNSFHTTTDSHPLNYFGFYSFFYNLSLNNNCYCGFVGSTNFYLLLYVYLRLSVITLFGGFSCWKNRSFFKNHDLKWIVNFCVKYVCLLILGLKMSGIYP